MGARDWLERVESPLAVAVVIIWDGNNEPP